MNKQNPNEAFEDGWNEMAKTFQNQFSEWLKMSEEYFGYMNDSRKKMVVDFQKQYGFENEDIKWLKMSEEYFDHMNDSRKKMVVDFQKQYGFENEDTKNIFQVAKTSQASTKKEKSRKPKKLPNSDTMEGNWKHLMEDAQKQWSKLTNDNLSQINGSREKLAGALQKNYGIAREEAEKQMKDWEKTRAQIVKSATN